MKNSYRYRERMVDDQPYSLIELFIKDDKGDIPEYDQDVLIMLARENILKSGPGRINNPWLQYGQDGKGVTCNMILYNGRITIHLSFSTRPGDGQDELNEVLDRFITIPYLKLMTKFFKENKQWED